MKQFKTIYAGKAHFCKLCGKGATERWWWHYSRPFPAAIYVAYFCSADHALNYYSRRTLFPSKQELIADITADTLIGTI